MSKTVNELFLKYADAVGMSLEEDRYFQYLFEMVQAGDNELSQQHRILHKVVDEKWLVAIEECLDSLNRIIEKPRRTIVREEEVVPVSLAKKITADSVRHLSMHTQFIASNQEGNIQPTHILNVSNNESFDLYENRFIYHLIQRMVVFIDKRTDVIFWSSGDEHCDAFKMVSHVDDAYEQIDYTFEMKIKNKQNFMDSDSDHMDVFMRIDRVRRLVLALKNSSFCSLMQGCDIVRSPIQRTNLLTKDPDYRNCYQLWQFLEKYDDVGYSVDVEDYTLEIDEEYLIQMYINLITNYSICKSVSEESERDMDAYIPNRYRKLRPIFKRILSEESINYDFEVEPTMLEEVSKGQLIAEEKLLDEEQLLEAKDKELAQLERDLVLLNAELNSAKDTADSLGKKYSEELVNRQETEDALLVEREEKELIKKQLEQSISNSEGLLSKINDFENREKSLLDEKNSILSSLEEYMPYKKLYLDQQEQNVSLVKEVSAISVIKEKMESISLERDELLKARLKDKKKFQDQLSKEKKSHKEKEERLKDSFEKSKKREFEELLLELENVKSQLKISQEHLEREKSLRESLEAKTIFGFMKKKRRKPDLKDES